MTPASPWPPETLLVSLLAGALNDNVSIMRHEDTIRVLAAAAGPLFGKAIETVYRAGRESAEANGADSDGAEATPATAIFAASLSSTLAERLKADLQEASLEANSGSWFTHDEVMRSLRESGRKQAAEREAAGEDASMLRGLAQEYDYRVAEAVDEEMANVARDLAASLRTLANRLDLRNAQW